MVPAARLPEESLRIVSLALALGASLTVSACATTGQYYVDPVAVTGQEVRYDRGTPTTYSEGEHGAIQMTPMGVHPGDGRLVFGIAAYNKGEAPGNFGVENIALATADGAPLRVFTGDQLVREAQGRANAATFAVALLGIATAVAAIDAADSTTYGSFWTRRGPVHYRTRYHDPGAAVFGTIVAGVGTGMAISSIHQSLDRTIAGIDNEILETTTIEPDQSYGGIVVADRPLAAARVPQEVLVNVRFNGDEHQFRYTLTRAR
jgi:hypothetical protein